MPLIIAMFLTLTTAALANSELPPSTVTCRKLTGYQPLDSTGDSKALAKALIENSRNSKPYFNCIQRELAKEKEQQK